MRGAVSDDGSSASLVAATEDPWLGTLLGRPALRITKGQSLDAHRAVVRRLTSERVFATAKVPTRDVGRVVELQDLGFRVVDTALIFTRGAWSGTPERGPRYARPEDRDAVTAIAERAFLYSRFHLDPAIPKAVADRIKAAWAENYFCGARGDAMVTVEIGSQLAGFLQLLRGSNGVLIIDLIAVDPVHARKGLGRSMITFAMSNGLGDGKKPASIVVGTQAANVPSVNLYEGLGFRLNSAQLVLHHHGTGQAYPDVENAP